MSRSLAFVCAVPLLAIAYAPLSPAQDSGEESRLRIVERRLDLSVRENVGILRLDLTIRNASDRNAEATFALAAPAGAAAFDLILSRNIASTERHAKAFAPAKARALSGGPPARIGPRELG